MVGDAEPLQAKVGGGLGHGGEGVLPVAGVGVVVKASPDLVAGEQVGQIVLFGGDDLPAVLAKFGRDEGKAEGFVEVFLLPQFHGGFGLSLEQPPFAQVKAPIDGALAKGDIVFFGSGEVGEGGGPSLGGDDAEVAGDASCEKDAGFCLPVGNDLFHIGCGNEGLHDDLGTGGGGNEVEVLDDFFSAPEATADFGFLDGGTFLYMFEQDFCGREGIAETVELAVGGAAGDGLEKVGGGFLPKAVEGGEAAVLAGFLEGLEGFDFQFFAEGPELLGSEAGQVEEGEKARGDGGAELIEVGEFAGGDQGGDFFAQGLPDARQLTEAVGADEFRQIGGGGLQGAGGGEVGPALERVLALQFENRADLPEGGGGLILGHGLKLSTDFLKGQGKWLVAIDRNGEAGDALGSVHECDVQRICPDHQPGAGVAEEGAGGSGSCADHGQSEDGRAGLDGGAAAFGGGARGDVARPDRAGGGWGNGTGQQRGAGVFGAGSGDGGE